MSVLARNGSVCGPNVRRCLILSTSTGKLYTVYLERVKMREIRNAGCWKQSGLGAKPGMQRPGRDVLYSGVQQAVAAWFQAEQVAHALGRDSTLHSKVLAKVAAMRERVALMDPEPIPSTPTSGLDFEGSSIGRARCCVPINSDSRQTKRRQKTGYLQDLERRERELAALRSAAEKCECKSLKRMEAPNVALSIRLQSALRGQLERLSTWNFCGRAESVNCREHWLKASQGYSRLNSRQQNSA